MEEIDCPSLGDLNMTLLVWAAKLKEPCYISGGLALILLREWLAMLRKMTEFQQAVKEKAQLL